MKAVLYLPRGTVTLNITWLEVIRLMAQHPVDVEPWGNRVDITSGDLKKSGKTIDDACERLVDALV